jgi:tRNA (guanine-N7-)-methyltransferase
VRRGVRLPLEALQPYLLEAAAEPTLLDWPVVYGNNGPVEIEVGFGKGLFLLTSGQGRPDTNFLGIEIERKYVLYTANRLAKRELHNVRVLCGDARILFRDMIREGSVQTVHVFFPDPWWKNKHRKRRLFTQGFAEECVRILKPQGKLHLVTDVEGYYQEILAMMAQQVMMEPLPPPEPSEPRHDFDYLTNFERKYRREGRPIYRVVFAKK